MMLDWLQNWYIENCDGDWEHSFGVEITTIDNPGWMVTIDVSETKIKDIEIDYVLIDYGQLDWMGYSITNKQFIGSGDPRKLGVIIEKFKEIWESK
jgi:hypothetical protein